MRVSGIEVWKMGEPGLIASSEGYYDAAVYEAQLAHGGGQAGCPSAGPKTGPGIG